MAIDLILINKIGLYAGSISTLVSYLILTGYRMIDVQKIQKIYFRLPKMALLLVAFIGMGMLSYQRNTLFDIFNFVLAFVLSILTNRKVIKQFIFLIKKKLRKRQRT